MQFILKRPHLKVFSSVCSNLFAGWFIAIFITPNLVTLTVDIMAAIVSLYLATKAEELLENYD